MSDLDEQVGRLREMGIEMQRPPSGPTVKVAMIADPDGNSIAWLKLWFRYSALGTDKFASLVVLTPRETGA